MISAVGKRGEAGAREPELRKVSRSFRWHPALCSRSRGQEDSLMGKSNHLKASDSRSLRLLEGKGC